MMFTERVALVTGAGRGIGAATAGELARRGAVVLVNDLDEAAAERTVLAIRGEGNAAEAAVADVTDASAVAAMYGAARERHGGVDLLVNNAGIVSRGRLADFCDEEWRRIVDVDLTGVYLVLKHFARLAARETTVRRAVVNVASMSYRGMTQQIAYVSAKGGVVSLTRGAAMELGRDGIRVNCVAPGMVETDMATVAGEGLRERMVASIPLRRYGTPAEVASTIAFLLSDDSAYITGETLHVAGGARL